jgi:hypothetical protein
MLFFSIPRPKHNNTPWWVLFKPAANGMALSPNPMVRAH